MLEPLRLQLYSSY
ncbi:hypothetical protein Pint_23846 [Pistacia integerrima]|uniref:Uncharacterized protein n=1 Tax=Pistacia integerrima TaxID=434235 RepID=A0ACC0YJB9_9ROSI|nr:hypothetical protein Pint_23846 [Pistacia integerrima]